MATEGQPADTLRVETAATINEAETSGRKRRRHYAPDAKARAVLRVLKGEGKEAIAAELGISVDRLERWQGTFFNAGLDALAKSSGDRTGLGAKLSANSGTLGQWIVLLLVLLVCILALVRLLTP